MKGYTQDWILIIGTDKGFTEGGGWEKGSMKNTSFNSMVSHALGYVKGWASKLIISEW